MNSGLSLSNHSYGTNTGWRTIVDPEGFPEGTYPIWHGVFGEATDRNFGAYLENARLLDEISWLSPRFLAIKSAGNARESSSESSVSPPPNGSTFLYFDEGVLTEGTRQDDYPPANFVKGGYNTLTAPGAAKNILTVGALRGGADTLGVVRPHLAAMTTYSSWGGTDDLRIKPDVVAMGTIASSIPRNADSGTGGVRGTSMAAPIVTGVAALIIEYFRTTFPSAPADLRGSTIKALIIHTADKRIHTSATHNYFAPDAMYGYGMVDAEAAIRLIQLFAFNPASGLIREDTLSAANPVREYEFYAPMGDLDIKATLVWTDPPGQVSSGLDDLTPVLVHDLDLMITAPNGVQYFPFMMAAHHNVIRGNNSRDTVEQVRIIVSVGSFNHQQLEGGKFTMRVSHKGTLTEGPQPFSLILTGHAMAGLGLTPFALDQKKLNFKVGSGNVDPDNLMMKFPLANLDNDPVFFQIDLPNANLSAHPASGRLSPGEQIEVRIAVNHNALNAAAGAYLGDAMILNVDTGEAVGIVADLELGMAKLPFSESFEPSPTGEPARFAPYWTRTGSPIASSNIAEHASAHSGIGFLIMDDPLVFQSDLILEGEEPEETVDLEPNRNELTLTIDLAGQTNVELNFWARSDGDTPDGPPAIPFVDSADFDGVAISVDGELWYEVQDLRNLTTAWQEYTVDLNAAADTHGLVLARPTYIRFNQFGNLIWNPHDPTESGGIAIDEITITGTPAVFTSAANGMWNSPATWSPAGIPGPGSQVTVIHSIELDGDAQVHSLDVVGTGELSLGTNRLTIDNGGSLNVVAGAGLDVSTGEIAYEGNATVFGISSYHHLETNGLLDLSSVSITGNLTLSGLGTTTISTDTTIPGSLELTGAATLEVEDGVTLTIGGNLTVGPGALYFGEGTTRFGQPGTSMMDLATSTTFANLTIAPGTILESRDNNAIVSGVLLNEGIIRNIRELSGNETSVHFGLTGATIDLDNHGSLTELIVERNDSTHPEAGSIAAINRFWTITSTGSGFTVSLTLPHDLDDQHPTAFICRHLGSGSWDCGRSASTTETVTRDGITDFSDWSISLSTTGVETWPTF